MRIVLKYLNFTGISAQYKFKLRSKSNTVSSLSSSQCMQNKFLSSILFKFDCSLRNLACWGQLGPCLSIYDTGLSSRVVHRELSSQTDTVLLRLCLSVSRLPPVSIYLTL